jgi:hypothetical protein
MDTYSIHPYLQLRQISTDADLIRRLPRRLAYYHLALPIAKEDDRITVAMARPDSPSIIKVLESVLNCPITPVRSDVDEIRSILNRVWQVENEAARPQILAWSAQREQISTVRSCAESFGEIFGAGVTYLEGDRILPESALQVSREGKYSLIVTNESLAMRSLLTTSPSPVLLVRGESCSLNSILLVLRGHAPDLAALELTVPLLQATGPRVTLMALAQGPAQDRLSFSSIAELLSESSNEGSHIAAFKRVLSGLNVQGRFKVRQGLAELEIAEEIGTGRYGLVIIAAEAFGDFVLRVLSALSERQAHNSSAILVVKPDLIASTSL